MIRSTNQEMGEYDLIRDPEHIAKVWKAVEASLPAYWTKFVEAKQETASARGGGAKSEGAVVTRVFDKSIASFEKEAKHYRQYFSPEAFEEYQDNPNAFKQTLSRDVPVIANTLRQRQAELKDWQAGFRRSKANDLLQVFANVFDFRAEWSDSHPVAQYTQIDTEKEFDLDPLDNDETMLMEGVIGMGIKSIVLHHMDPERLPPRGRQGLYALFFLAGKNHFGLPTESSEFLMINDVSPASDGSIIMDQNYWYPYGLFSLYALRVYRWIDQRATTAGFTLDRSVRFVYVERFFSSVCALHANDLKTMRAHERFEVPG